MQRHATSAALAIVLAGATLSSRANTVASTTLSDFRIAVVDLDPADGIAASVSLDPFSRSVALAGLASPGASTFWVNQGTSAFGATSVSGILDGTGTGGAAAVSGDPFGAGALFVTSAVGASNWGVGLGETYIDDQPSAETQLTLSAHSEVVFTGNATLTWQAGHPAAAAGGDVDLGFLLDSEVVARDEFQDGYGSAEDGAEPPAGNATQAMSVRFSNTSDAPLVLDYFVDVVASASEVDVVASPVSEPGEAGLLLAGTLPAWFGLAVARRRRDASER